MSLTAFQRVSSFTSLKASWSRLWHKTRKKSRGTYGVDKQSLNDFVKNDINNLHNLSIQLRRGDYKFSKLRPIFIEKASGGIRVICIPTTKDRIVQGALLDFLSDKYTTRFSNKISYGFLKNRTVKNALEIAKQRRLPKSWVFKTDIKSFFDQIQRDSLKEKIKHVVRELTLHKLLLEIVGCEIDASSRGDKRKILSLGIQPGLGIRQGMPLSLFFSNILLEKFDQAVDSAGYSALRYADDLVFFSKDRVGCDEIETFCRRKPKKEGLEIPLTSEKKTKTIVYNPKDSVEFLGVSICKDKEKYQIKILPDQIRKIRDAIMDLGNIQVLLSRKNYSCKAWGIT